MRTSVFPVGAWPSGLYFARLAAVDGRVGFAPFVVRPRVHGEHRVAIVLPTLTWQAYNLRDGGSWWGHSKLSSNRYGGVGAPVTVWMAQSRSASWRVANGAAIACSSVTTVMPFNGLIIFFSLDNCGRIHR